MGDAFRGLYASQVTAAGAGTEAGAGHVEAGKLMYHQAVKEATKQLLQVRHTSSL